MQIELYIKKASRQIAEKHGASGDALRRIADDVWNLYRVKPLTPSQIEAHVKRSAQVMK